MKHTINLSEDEVKNIIADFANRCMKTNTITAADVTLSVGKEYVGVGPMEHSVAKFRNARVEVKENERSNR